MKRRAFLGLGVSSISVGTLYGTGAFSAVSAGRGIAVNAADDANALVALDVAAQVASKSTGERLVTVTNNFGDTLDVTVELTGQAAADETITLANRTLTLGADSTGDVRVDLDKANPDTDEITFDLTAETDSASVTLSRGGVTVTNPGGGGGNKDPGPVNFSAGDVRSENGGFVQTFSYNVDALKSGDGATIDLSDAQANAGVDYSNASASVVSNQKVSEFTFDRSVPEIRYVAQSNVKGTLEIEVTDIELTSDVDGTAFYSDDFGETAQDTFAVPAVGTSSGDVSTSGDAVVPDGESAGEIEASGDVTLGDTATANNEVEAGGDLTSGDDATFHGEVEAEGNAELGTETTVNNGIETGGDLAVGDDSTVSGELDAGGDVTLGERTTVNDELEATGDVVVGADSVVHGELETDGDVYLRDGATLNDDVDADTIYEGCNVTIHGDVDGQQVDDCQ